jgi:hypothetical protein
LIPFKLGRDSRKSQFVGHLLISSLLTKSPEGRFMAINSLPMILN